MSKWVSIKERKPKNGVLKLMCDMNYTGDLQNVMYVGWFAGGVEVSRMNGRSATHWMNLPICPSEEQS